MGRSLQFGESEEYPRLLLLSNAILYDDHWQSAPDGIKTHDFLYWAPLSSTPTDPSYRSLALSKLEAT